MSSIDYSKIISMDKAAKKFIKLSLQLANSVMVMTGIAILMYSFWMIVVCLRDYQKYHFPWFLWACLGTGIIFNFIANLGYAAVHAKRSFLLTLYIVFLFLLMLVEGLITGDIWLNDEWDKDFPKDYTDLFDDFVDCVDSNWNLFKWLCLMIAFSQIISFFLAMVLRIMGKKLKYQDEEVASAKLPFLYHQIQRLPPYAIGHPEPYYCRAVSTAPYEYMHGYAVVAANEKGKYEATTTLQANPNKGC